MSFDSFKNVIQVCIVKFIPLTKNKECQIIRVKWNSNMKVDNIEWPIFTIEKSVISQETIFSCCTFVLEVLSHFLQLTGPGGLVPNYLGYSWVYCILADITNTKVKFVDGIDWTVSKWCLMKYQPIFWFFTIMLEVFYEWSW